MQPYGEGCCGCSLPFYGDHVVAFGPEGTWGWPQRGPHVAQLLAGLKARRFLGLGMAPLLVVSKLVQFVIAEVLVEHYRTTWPAVLADRVEGYLPSGLTPLACGATPVAASGKLQQEALAAAPVHDMPQCLGVSGIQAAEQGGTGATCCKILGACCALRGGP